MKRRLMALFLALTMLVSMAPGVSAVDTGFSDVASDAWYAEAVKWAVDNNITGGIGDGKFGPDQTCTRGQVVTFLWAAAGKPVRENTVNPFADVSASDWYYNAVMWAVENNITGGTSATTFSPEAPCTRAAVVTFLYAAEGKPAVDNVENDFSDVAANDWFYAPVMWAVQNGITGGIGNGCFGPDNPCTRGQIALFLYKADGIEGGVKPTPHPASEGVGYAVCETEFVDGERKTLRALVSAEEDCTLVMEVLSEDGSRQLARTEMHIDAGTVLQRVEGKLQMSAALPQYVLLRAALLYVDGNPLNEPLVSRHYTQAYAQFEALRESDYDLAQVIDLVDENDGNFAVVHEEVVRIEQSDTVNVLQSRENGICVFDGADDVLSGMQKGEKLMIVDADGLYAGIIIEEITVSADGRVQIREKSDIYLSDFYQMVKLKTDLVGQPEVQGAIEQVSAQMYGSSGSSSNHSKYMKEISLGPAFTNSIETPFGYVEPSLSAGGKLEYVYCPEKFGLKYMEYSILVGVKGQLEVHIAPNMDRGEEIALVKIPLAGVAPIGEIPAKLSLDYYVNCESGGVVTVEAEALTGFVFNTDSGTQRINYKDSSQRELEVHTGITVEVGLRASIGAEFFDGLLSASMGVQVGANLVGNLKALGTALPDTESYHACLQCIDGHLTGVFEVDIKASYKINEWLEGDVLDLDLLHLEWAIGRCHLSLINAEDSVYKGMIKWGMGACPNRKYRVTMELYYNGVETGGTVKLWTDEYAQTIFDTQIAEKEVPYSEYLYPGKYCAHAVVNDMYGERKFTVDDDGITVKVEVNDPRLSCTAVKRDELGYLTADIVVEKDGVQVFTGTSDAMQGFSVQLERGVYTVTCSAKNYISETREVILNEDTSLLFELEPMPAGRVTGTVNTIKTEGGVETKVPVDTAAVTVYSAETGEAMGTISMAAAEDGIFIYDIPMGNYTIKVIADGYDTYESGFVVTSENVMLDVVMVPKGTNEAAYAAYVPMVEQAIRDTKNYFGKSALEDNEWSYGYLSDLDDDGIDELVMNYYHGYYKGSYCVAYPVYSVYDYEDGALVKVVERERLTEGEAGGDIGYAVVVDFDGKPTIMTMDQVGYGGGPGTKHLYNHTFHDYPSMERKYLLGYWQEEGESGPAAEKFYVNDAEVTKERLILEMTRCPELKFSQRGYDFYCGDPMSLNETLKAVRGPVIYKGTVYADKFTEGVTDKVPVPNAEIKLWCWDDETETEIGDTVYADEKGCFEIDLTDVQGYDAEISAEGYISKTTSFSADDEKLEASIRLVPDIYEAVVQAFMDKYGYNYMDTNQRNRSRGMLCDLNGDGQDELIMRAMQKDGRVYENTYEIWTMENGETKLLLEYTPNLLGEYLSIVEYNGNRYFVLEEVSPGTMAVAIEWRFYDVNDTPYELFMHLDYWEMHDGSEGAYAIDGQNVTKAEIYSVKDNITTVFELFKEWEGGYDGYPLYEFVYQKVG